MDRTVQSQLTRTAGKKWTIERMLDEACAFPKKVASGREPIAAIIKGYGSLRSFEEGGHRDFLLSTRLEAHRIAERMLDDSTELEKIAELLTKAEKDVQQVEMVASTAKEPYTADIVGLSNAINDIAAAKDIILKNADLLESDPSATYNTTPALQEYDPPRTFKDRIPTIKPLKSTILRPVIGSIIAACSFSVGSKPQAYVFWQDTSNAIYSAALDTPDWTCNGKAVVPAARGGSPIATCCSSDGKVIQYKVSICGAY